MKNGSQSTLEPRKSPVQARSVASVDAILKATIQVLLKVGKERLTTTRVAARGGVSVGTLYQYFPNKSALLKAALLRHLDEVATAVETVCREQRGSTLEKMATELGTRFLEAKMREARTSVAFYAVSSDVDGAKILRDMNERFTRAMLAAFATAQDELTTDPQLVVAMLQGIMAGISRRLLESASPERDYERLRDEMALLVGAYIRVRSRPRP